MPALRITGRELSRSTLTAVSSQLSSPTHASGHASPTIVGMLPPVRRALLTCLCGYLLAIGAGIGFAIALRNAGNWLDGLPWEHDVLVAVNAYRMPFVIDWLLLVLPWFG